jgi:hypothetical protein
MPVHIDNALYQDELTKINQCYLGKWKTRKPMDVRTQLTSARHFGTGNRTGPAAQRRGRRNLDGGVGAPKIATRRERHSTRRSVEGDFREMAAHPSEGLRAPIHFKLEYPVEDDKIVACIFVSIYFAGENIPYELPTH